MTPCSVSLTHDGYALEVLPPLKDDTQGITLQWKYKDKQYNRILLSKFAKTCRLLLGSLPTSVLETLCASTAVSTQTLASCVFAVTNTGELMLVHLAHGTVKLVLLVHTNPQVTWVGAIKGDGAWYVCVVHQIGDVILMAPSDSTKSSVWNSFSLDSPSICCCAVDNYLVTSDGSYLKLYTVQVTESSNPCGASPCTGCRLIKLKKISLDVFGVVAIEYDNNNIMLRTASRRKYKCTWKTFLEKAIKTDCDKNDASNNRKSDKTEDIPSIDHIMKELEKCDKLNALIQNKSDILNRYIQQLNIAQNLYQSSQSSVLDNDAHDIIDHFHLTCEIGDCLDGLHMYTLRCSLKCTLSIVNFEQQWWRVRISVPTPTDTLRHVVFTSKHELKDNCVLIGFTREEAEHLLTGQQDKLYITCDVIFNDYINAHPVYCTQVAKKRLNVMMFLKKQRIISTGSSPKLSFSEALLAQDRQFVPSENNYLTADIHRLSLTFPRSTSLLINILQCLNIQMNEKNDPNEHYPINEDRWFCDETVSLRVSLSSDCVSVVVSGACVTLVVGIKRELYRVNCAALLSIDSKSDDVTVPATTVQESYMTQRYLDTLDGATVQMAQLKTLYEQMSQLIDSFP